MKSSTKSNLPEDTRYFARKIGINYNFNYDLYSMIKDFNFTDFLNTDTRNEHGGIIVITNNQYIVGYTEGFGVGSHRVAFARVMKDLNGGGRIQDYNEAKKLADICTNNFITARILYDYRGDNEFGTPTYSGTIYFDLPTNDTITYEQYKSFEKFYEDYNKELEILIRKYGSNKFNIQFGCIDENGTKAVKIVDSLNEIYNYLETRIDQNKKIDDKKEIILGIPTKESNHKTKIKNKPNN